MVILHDFALLKWPMGAGKGRQGVLKRGAIPKPHNAGPIRPPGLADRKADLGPTPKIYKKISKCTKIQTST